MTQKTSPNPEHPSPNRQNGTPKMQDQKTTLIGITTDPETGHTTIELETDNHQREQITVTPPTGTDVPESAELDMEALARLAGAQDMNREGGEHE